MAIIQGGNAAATPMLVDTQHGAARLSIRPPEVLGAYSVGAVSGLATGIAANGPVLSLRNLSANLLMIRRLSIGFVTTTAFTTAQGLAFAAVFARAFTASDTGGTAIALTGAQNKVRTSLATPTSLELRVATTSALGAGTRTLDTVALGVANGFSSTIGSNMPLSPVLAQDATAYPIVLGQNEGLVITNLLAMGAAGVVQLHINLDLAEVASF